MGEPIILYARNGKTREAHGLAEAAALTADGVWYATAEAAQAAGTEPVKESAPPAPDKPTQRKGAKS